MTGINGISDPFLQKYNSDLAANMSEQKAKQSQHMRELLRTLKQTPVQNENPYSAMSKDRANGFLDLTETKESEKEDKNDIPYNYNFKEVESRIQRAKTSVSAGQAVVSARRKVLEVRRKMASSKNNAEELQLALTHARRMEMVAKKKKHHLELEELARTVSKRDEKLEQQEQAAVDMKNSMVTADEEKIVKRQDEIFDERIEMISEAAEQMNDQMLKELNEKIAEFGEDELRELEEAMEMLENMEMIDPHMTKEDLDELKRKHRASEQKAMMKADMDYLKGMIKLNSAGKGMSSVSFPSAAVSNISLPAMSVPTVSTPVSVSIDVQV
ncbi:MAG: hypothetical protein J6W58_05935 [Lachnospiraceae bacterium]|nr:hypothetical protein [Lachnospiraceae bacterium]